MNKKRIALYGGAFNAPTLAHHEIAEMLIPHFDEIWVIPSGPRPDKPDLEDINPIDRAIMTDLTFYGLPKTTIKLFDLENNTFTRNHTLQKMFQDCGELWHVIGADHVSPGKDGMSRIEREWDQGKRLWQELNFAVVVRQGYTLDTSDLPLRHELFYPSRSESSSMVRDRVSRRESISGLVMPEVEKHIERYNLYRGHRRSSAASFKLDSPRLLIVADPRNPDAMALKEKWKDLENEAHPNLIVSIGGDGNMFRTVRAHWRKRLPFMGINRGHLGYLLNDVARDVSPHDLFSQQLEIIFAPLLYTEMTGLNGQRHSEVAFNDAYVLVERGKTGWFEIMVDNEIRTQKLEADGVLVATPAGSTAYARSMGASPVTLGAEELVVVGSNVSKPHIWRNGANVSDSSVIRVRTLDESHWRGIAGFADNVSFGDVTEMTVRKSKIAAVELVFLPGHEKRRRLLFNPFPV
ncbi:MAG: NAD(+)/NADH kinase [Candidatus Sungbacteria bacterium]|nr:NAD(+)/NADH kinase [bacterium]MDZ4260609.1 NAD(+)/NADH kinase [Candidatus Sungbacteria bacterium]